MAKFKGQDVTVRIASGTAALGTATPIGYVTHVEWNATQNIEASPKGLGYRTKETYEGLIDYSGRIERDYDATAVEGGSIFAQLVQPTGTAALTPLYVKVSVGSGGKYWILKKCKGDYTQTADEDGYVHETWDFLFEELEQG